MGLYRRNAADFDAKYRRTVSCWTSLGVFAVLLVSIVGTMAWQSYYELDIVAIDETPAGHAPARRLKKADEGGGSTPINDPIITKPYKSSDRKPLVFIHIILIAYMLLGLNTVCDLYFTGALDEMVMKWNIKPDVAGATFMAAGGSAPELFTSLIGAVISESDVGFGTIVGSAVFNVLFVIGLCGFAAKVPIKLTWWPLARDCSYYIMGLSLLALCAKTGGEITIWEAVVLFLFYLGYCTMMYYNSFLESKFVKSKPDVTPSEMTPVTPVTVVTGPVADTGSTSDKHHIKKSQPHFERRSQFAEAGSSKERQSAADKKDTEAADGEKASGVDGAAAEDNPDDAGEEEEEDADDIEELLLRPEGTGPFILWCLSLPIYLMLYYGIPKPSERCFMATFAVSLCFIAGYSFVLVYCVEVLGAVLGIHIIVMGFTLLAAGTSIPDLVSSMAVARAGEGDMAVSSSIGSNIFDILVGLPIPWVIKIGLVEMLGKGNTDATVRIRSGYIVFYVLILIFMVFCVILCIHFLGWYLNRTLGVGMASLYALFLIIVLSVEFSEPDALKF